VLIQGSSRPSSMITTSSSLRLDVGDPLTPLETQFLEAEIMLLFSIMANTSSSSTPIRTTTSKNASRYSWNSASVRCHHKVLTSTGTIRISRGPPLPVGIVCGCKYIFLENIGILGDLAAGKG